MNRPLDLINARRWLTLAFAISLLAASPPAAPVRPQEAPSDTTFCATEPRPSLPGGREARAEAARLPSELDALRLDQMQVIGTHNSYHRAPHPAVLKLIAKFDPKLAASLDCTHRFALDNGGRIRDLYLDGHPARAVGGCSRKIPRAAARPPPGARGTPRSRTSTRSRGWSVMASWPAPAPMPTPPKPAQTTQRGATRPWPAEPSSSARTTPSPTGDSRPTRSGCREGSSRD